MHPDESTPEQVNEQLVSPEERLVESLQSGNDGIPTDVDTLYEQGEGEDDEDIPVAYTNVTGEDWVETEK